jgi:hypothetical protein
MRLGRGSSISGLLLLALCQSATLASAQLPYDWQWVCRNVPAAAEVCRAAPTDWTNIIPYHMEQRSAVFPKVTGPHTVDAEILIEMLGVANHAAINALQLTILRSDGLKGAAAVFLRRPMSGEKGPQGAPLPVTRLIIYDPEWARTANAEYYLVLGHEVGHHFCGHTLENANTSPLEGELEADRFSGAAIRSFEVYHGKSFIDDALRAAARRYSEAGSRTHPPRARRIEAIQVGYRQGWPCGNLAPPQRGFTQQPR